jgi:hypothetical protein
MVSHHRRSGRSLCILNHPIKKSNLPYSETNREEIIEVVLFTLQAPRGVNLVKVKGKPLGQEE